MLVVVVRIIRVGDSHIRGEHNNVWIAVIIEQVALPVIGLVRLCISMLKEASGILGVTSSTLRVRTTHGRQCMYGEKVLLLLGWQHCLEVSFLVFPAQVQQLGREEHSRRGISVLAPFLASCVASHQVSQVKGLECWPFPDMSCPDTFSGDHNHECAADVTRDSERNGQVEKANHFRSCQASIINHQFLVDDPTRSLFRYIAVGDE